MALLTSLFGVDHSAFRKDPIGYPLDSTLWGTRTNSGERVNQNNAMALSPYWAAKRSIAEDCGKAPVGVYRRLERGRERQREHPADILFRRNVNPWMTPMAFKEKMFDWALGWGGGVARIVRDRGLQLWPIHPSRIEVEFSDPDNALYYHVRDEHGAVETLNDVDVFHLHGLGDNGTTGYSILGYAAESIGLGLAAQRFGAQFFGNGTRLTGYMKHPETVSPEAHERLKASVKALRALETPVFEEGMEYVQLGIPPEEAQYLQTRQFQIEEVCRWFRMPPSKLQHLLKANFNTLEMQNQEYFQDTLTPWLIRFEEEANRKLLLPAESDSLYFRFTMNALQLADAKTRQQFYTGMFKVAGLSPNEIRELEEWNTIENGDLHFIEANNMVPIDGELDTLNARTQPTPQRSGPAPEGSETEDPDAAANLTHPILVEALQRMLTKELNACEREMRRHDSAGLIEWATAWYVRHAQQLHDALAPAVRLFAELNERARGVQESRAATVEQAERVLFDWCNCYVEGRRALVRSGGISEVAAATEQADELLSALSESLALVEAA